MRIQVTEVGAVESATGKGGKTYKVFGLTFKNNGKKQNRKITQYSEVYETFKTAEAGDTFDVTVVKDGEYFNWTGAAKVLDATPASDETVSTKSNGSGKKGDWETAEERAARQERITRQASINAALQYFEVTQKEEVSLEEVLQVAQTFRDYAASNDNPFADSTEPDRAA